MAPTKTWEKELEKLQAREKEAQLGGGEARLQKLREKGILTARERMSPVTEQLTAAKSLFIQRTPLF